MSSEQRCIGVNATSNRCRYDIVLRLYACWVLTNIDLLCSVYLISMQEKDVPRPLSNDFWIILFKIGAKRIK